MALGASTFTDFGAAVQSLFSGISAEEQASLQAQGLQIQSQGTQISAEAAQLQAQGDIAEGQEYTQAQQLAQQQAQYTAASTAIQSVQQQRQVTMTIGAQQAAAGASGLASSGSALDVMNESAQQGALANAVLKTQGLITEAGYNEQAASYKLMAGAAQTAATGEQQISGQEQTIATEQQQLASETQQSGLTGLIGGVAGGLLKGAAAIATLF